MYKVRPYSRYSSSLEVEKSLGKLIKNAQLMIGKTQNSLRRIIELYSKSIRFIFITKQVSSLIDPINDQLDY